MSLNLIQESEINGALFDLAVYQGKTYEIILRIDGDYTAGVLEAQIRDNFLNDGGTLLASFLFSDVTYDSIETKTSMRMILNSAVTTLLEATRLSGNATPSVRNCYVYDVEYTLTGVVSLICRGFVQVLPEVTD